MLTLLIALVTATAPTIGVGKVSVALDPKAKLGPRAAGLLCAPNGDIHWRRDLTEADFGDAPALIVQAVETAGFKATADPTGLFAGAVAPGDYLIGGRVTAAQGEICFPSHGAPILFRSRTPADGQAKGSLILQVDWQVYSLAQRKVVLTLTTGGQGTLERKTYGGVRELTRQALSGSLRYFLNQPDVRTLLASAPGAQDRLDRHP